MADDRNTPAHDEVKLDFARADRIGLEEVVYAAGKSIEQLKVILHAALERGSRLFVTRLSTAQFDALPAPLRGALDYCAVSSTARLGEALLPGRPPRIAILAAGSSDVPAAREAERTLAYQGEASGWFADIGVAGLWRLTSRLEEIAAYPVLIVAAGMDAALPTVVGGLVGSVIVGLPTSVGYGVATGGRVALGAMLSSCAPGIAVVNIDNGYGAACAAIRVVRAIERALSPGGESSSGIESPRRSSPCNAVPFSNPALAQASSPLPR